MSSHVNFKNSSNYVLKTVANKLSVFPVMVIDTAV